MILVAVCCNAIIAVSYYVITYQLFTTATSSQVTGFFNPASDMGNEKKRNLYSMMVGLVLLFAAFIWICGTVHALRVVDLLHPNQKVVEVFLDVVVVLCAFVSLVTAIAGYRVLPTIVDILHKFELNSEGNLEHVENYMLEIVEMVKESIMVVTEDLKILRGNEATKSLFGTETLIGRPVMDFIHPDDFREFELATQVVLCSYSLSPVTIEYRIKPVGVVHSRKRSATADRSSTRTKVYCSTSTDSSVDSNPFDRNSSMGTLLDGSSPGNSVMVGTPKAEFVWVETTMCKRTKINANEVLEYSLEMVSRDINDRKVRQLNQYASMLKETEEQGRINAAKLRYLSCIAHDLKTPLQSFCYTLDLLLQTRVNVEQKELVQQANVAVDLMKLTISQTMDISKALTGAKLMPRRTTVYLSSVLKRVNIIINGYSKQVPVTIRVEPGIKDEIITDEEWLWQMLLNLLTNACKYTDKGSIQVVVSLSDSRTVNLPSLHSELTMSEKVLKANLQLLIENVASPEMLLFEVIDTGVGVSAPHMRCMFDAFAQVQDGQVTGTGLGLFGVRTRAEGLQGTCGARNNVESSTGTGTVMWFAIPYLPDGSRPSSGGGDNYDHRSFADIEEGGGELSKFADIQPLTISMSTSTPQLLSPQSSPSKESLSWPDQVLPPPLGSPKSPMANSSPSELARRANHILKTNSVRAIVVEDTLTVRKLMERMLLQLGFSEVVGYENGSKGLDALMLTEVDIVFSDVQMPIMTGPEMVNRFRRFEAEALATGTRKKRQVVVAVTANGSEMKDNSGGGAGFDDIYPKPLSRQDIYKIVNKFL